MANYANQLTIVTGPRVKKDIYAILDIEALQTAMKDLSPSGLLLYLYFAKNSEGYKFSLSEKACEDWGLKSSSYTKAKKELINKGYLTNLYNSTYQFNEIPIITEYDKDKLPIIREIAVGENAEFLEDDVVRLGDGGIYRVLPF